MGLHWWISGKESSCNARDVSSVPRSERSLGGGNGYPLQYCRLENPTDRGHKELDTTEQLNHHQPPGDSEASSCTPKYSIMSNSFVTQWTVAHQTPMSMGFPRQEYWSGLPCPPPGDLPNSRIEPTSVRAPALTGRFFTTSATWESHEFLQSYIND